MIRNASYVMSLIEDPTNRAKKAQVGVDLTINAISRINGDLEVGQIFSDDTLNLQDGIHKNSFSTYTSIPVQIDRTSNISMFVLKPGVYSIEFEQGLKPLPKNNTAFIYHRSTLGRNGVMIRSAVYDPGFTTPKMGAILEVLSPIKIERFARVAQIVIFENEDVDNLYNGAYQGEKDKR